MDDMKSMLIAFGKKHGVDLEIETPNTEEERLEMIKKAEEMKRDFFNNSEGTLHETDGYNCDLCKNKGGSIKVELRGSMWQQVFVPCKCARIRAMITKLERSGLKNVIKDYTFDKYETTEPWQKSIKEKAIQFTKDDEGTWFFLGGTSGCGKTHLCTAITAHYLRKNKPARYMLWRDEITRIKAVINDSIEYQKIMEELKKVDVLYIDDLFKMGKDSRGIVQAPTVADINVAFEILNYRYNNKSLITIISSERTIQEIIDIDEAVGGRISEMTIPKGYYIGIKKDPKKNYRTKGIIEL